MPKLTPETISERRRIILNAAEVCFARAGFHRTTMQDICSQAGISAGALYGYFESKEDLIAGIAERNRNKIAEQLTELADAPDLVQALARLGEYYTIEEPQHKRILCVEIGAEATRNETVGEIFHSVDTFVQKSLEQLFARAAETGRIAPRLEPKTLAQLLCIIGDGLFWRRAVDPSFDAKELMPAITNIIELLMNPPHPPEATPSADTPAEVE